MPVHNRTDEEWTPGNGWSPAEVEWFLMGPFDGGVPGLGLVPETVVTRPPSAELRPDQRDQDSLPPYEVLDAILEGYVEQIGRAHV